MQGRAASGWRHPSSNAQARHRLHGPEPRPALTFRHIYELDRLMFLWVGLTQGGVHYIYWLYLRRPVSLSESFRTVGLTALPWVASGLALLYGSQIYPSSSDYTYLTLWFGTLTHFAPQAVLINALAWISSTGVYLYLNRHAGVRKALLLLLITIGVLYLSIMLVTPRIAELVQD